jgi:hypothetical protein
MKKEEDLGKALVATLQIIMMGGYDEVTREGIVNTLCETIACLEDLSGDLECANSALSLKNKWMLHLEQKNSKYREALEYYATPCDEGCSPCDHLIARTALKED